MKTLKLALALCALSGITKAQPLTGQNFYNHMGNTAVLSSGTYVNNSFPGFIMGGYSPNAAAGGPFNFFIDKVTEDGTFFFNTDFSRAYSMYDAGNDCKGTCFRQEQSCYGVSVVQSNTNACAGISYAATAAFNAGVVFLTLNQFGSIVSQSFFAVPPGAVLAKPLIASSITGDFYLCGSYHLGSADFMYAMRVNSSGTPVWSSVYDQGISTGTLLPHSIIESNYAAAGPELAIVGTTGGAITTDGFFMTLDGNTGAQLIVEALASGFTVDESLSSISLAAANGGFILGGSTDMAPNSGRAWMTRISSTGVIGWTRRITPSTNNIAGEVVGVTERFSPVYNAYEYYGVTVSNGSNGGMLVLKLDQNGNSFSQPGNTNNEFLYNPGNGNIALSGAISQLDAGASGNNTGIHVFGTDQNNPGDFFLTQACFNGATGTCPNPNQQFLTMQSSTSGPAITYTFVLNVNNGLNRCPYYLLVDNLLNYQPNQPCPFNGLPPGGDNSRVASPGSTGSQLHTPKAGAVSVYPNPVSNVTEVSYTTQQPTSISITLTDITGKLIKTLDAGYKTAGTNTLAVDMQSLNLQTGVYFVSVNMGGTVTQQKIIYTKE